MLLAVVAATKGVSFVHAEAIFSAVVACEVMSIESMRHWSRQSRTLKEMPYYVMVTCNVKEESIEMNKVRGHDGLLRRI